MTAMRLRDLLQQLKLMDAGGADLEMEVILRIQNDEGDTAVGGLVSVQIDAGCTEIDALMLDGSTETVPEKKEGD